MQQFGGYQGYHGVEGPEQEDGSGDLSPRPAKEQHIPRELRRLRDHSVSVSDSEAKSSFPAGPRHTPASSLPIPEVENAPAQRPLATRSADQGTKKRFDISRASAWLSWRSCALGTVTAALLCSCCICTEPVDLSK